MPSHKEIIQIDAEVTKLREEILERQQRINALTDQRLKILTEMAEAAAVRSGIAAPRKRERD